MNADKIKKISYFAAGIIIIAFFTAFLASKNLKDPKLFGPELTFEKESQSFGEIPQGPKLEGTFIFTNTGRNVLEIKNVRTSCGCTGAVVDEKSVFEPGEQGKIKFTFNTEGRAGHNEKVITVYSNDMKHPQREVRFDCDIKEPSK